MASTVPKATLNNGLQIPILGLGTWKSKPGEVTEAVKAAIDVGYRHFDCAHVYGNEREVGEAIQQKIAEGVVKRENLWITSKLWNNSHRADRVEPALRKTLEDLGLEYLDLYLIHWPMAFITSDDLFPMTDDGEFFQVSDDDYVDTWLALEKTVRKGLTKSIGISNFNSVQTDRILEVAIKIDALTFEIADAVGGALESHSVWMTSKVRTSIFHSRDVHLTTFIWENQVATIKPVTNQVECHPYLNQKKLSAFCKERDIILTGYSPLGSPDRPWAQPGDPQLLDEEEIQAIAQRLGKTPAQVVLRYQIQLGNVTIPKSVTPARIAENFQVFNFELSEDDMAALDSFDRNGRMCSLQKLGEHIHDPFTIPY